VGEFFVLFAFSALSDGFTPDIVTGILAVFIAGIYWWVAGQFLSHPSHSILNNLRTIMISLVVTGFLAIATTALYWGELYVETAIGFVALLAGAFLMNQFITEGRSLLM
jgi:hypothetical protein